MTPTSIRTGRKLDASFENVASGAGSTVSLAPGQGDRVAVSIAVTSGDLTTLTAPLAIGPKVSGVVVALTALNAGHPVCYLSVDKLGSAIIPELFCVNSSATAFTLGVTLVRQTQPLE